MFKLGWSDVTRGLTVAILAPLVTSILSILGAIILAPGFDVFSVDWNTLGHTLANSAIVSSYGGFAGYISKQFLSDNQGNVLGIGSR